MKQRTLTIVLTTLGLLLALTLFALAFGKPQAPQQARVSPNSAGVAIAREADPAAEETAVPGTGNAPTGDVSSAEGTGVVPAPDPSSPLAIEIPGCKCHSDDPELVQEHAQYRMNQCFGCHAGGMPEMEQ